MKRNKHLLLSFIVFLFVLQTIDAQVYQNNCLPDTLVIDTSGYEINWQQFPDFQLPFTIIYHGNAPADSTAWPLKKGFTHIDGNAQFYRDTIWPEQRAYNWTGIANADNWAYNTSQPWRMIKSPWENDIPGYRERWDHRFDVILDRYKYQPLVGQPAIDIVIADLEWAFHTDAGILSIKNDPLVPLYYQNLTDDDFIAAYKKDMSLLYAEALKYAKDSLHTTTKISSYAEVPVRRTWWTIDDTTWQGWTGDSSTVDYLMEDSSGFMNSVFYNSHDIICPSVYYFYNVDSVPIGKKYLAYNLFQSEVNSVWSDKDQLVYCWLNYHGSGSLAIKPWMAEATAIFPLMSGAKGLYPWKPVQPQGYDSYEYFIKGLYRLSQFNDFFDGNEIFVNPTPAHESFINSLPIWRGVVNGYDILIAAHNPFANPSDTTFIPVSYGNWSETIALIGTEVFLCSFDMWYVGAPELPKVHEVEVYPNPTNGMLHISSAESINQVNLIDLSGKITMLEDIDNQFSTINISRFPTNTYVLEIITDNRVYYKKIIKN